MGNPSRTEDRQAARLPEVLSDSGTREALLAIPREKQWIAEQQLAVCRIPAPTFREEKRAEWMVGQFRELGYEAQVDRGGNVVANGGGTGPLVAVTAHLDTVLAPRKPEEIVVEADGTLRGPGVSDNGAGLAALLALAKVLRTGRIDGAAAQPVFVANVGEEGEGNLSGMRYLCRQSPLAGRIRAYLVLDGPSTEVVTSRALASRRFEVVFTGSGGHSWSDFGAGNPVHALARTITAFADARQMAADRDASFNFGLVDGGASITSIPAEARLKLDLRSELPGALDEMAQLLTACVEQAVGLENQRAATRISARVREIGSRPGGAVADDAAIVVCLRAVDAHLGIRSVLDCASTDANIPLSMGIPALSLGTGGQGGGAHTAAEWYHPAGRDQGLSRILLLLALLLREA